MVKENGNGRNLRIHLIPTNEVANFCYVFSHPLRLKIALLLNKGDLCVCEIVSILKERQNLVSHHISIMKKYSVISSYNQSKYKYYMIEGVATDFLSALSDKMMI